MKHRSIHHTVYPLSYNKNATAKQRTKDFNNWQIWLNQQVHANELGNSLILGIGGGK